MVVSFIKENKIAAGLIAVAIAVIVNISFSAFSSGPSQAVVDRMEIGKQDGLRDDLIQSASGSIQVKLEAINKLQSEVADLDTCLDQLSQEMGTKTQSKACSQRVYGSGSTIIVEGSGSVGTGVILNQGTEATPTVFVQEKPQA